MEPSCSFSCHHFLRLVFPEVLVLVEAAVNHLCAVLRLGSEAVPGVFGSLGLSVQMSLSKKLRAQTSPLLTTCAVSVGTTKDQLSV